QAEDGIRGFHVTGVQTCALPIFVIDEVHHIAAASYRAVLEYFTPTILLGLTATPERHDGSDILADFGGVIAAEIRLPEAINRRQIGRASGRERGEAPAVTGTADG